MHRVRPCCAAGGQVIREQGGLRESSGFDEVSVAK